MYRLSTDVGGTFTDGILLDEATGKIEVTKVSSTPDNPAIGTIQSIERFEIPLNKVSFLVHGTTVVINALIEGKGAKAGVGVILPTVMVEITNRPKDKGCQDGPGR